MVEMSDKLYIASLAVVTDVVEQQGAGCTTLVQIVLGDGQFGVTLECCGEVFCGEAFRGSFGEEALGIRKGSAGPLVATGIRPGRNQV